MLVAEVKNFLPVSFCFFTKMHTLPVLIALCCTCIMSVQSSCSTDGLDSCYFETWDSCDWTGTAGSTEYEYDSDDYCLGLNGNQTSRLESKTACSTDSTIHCLNFWYYFKDDDVLDLSVFIKTDDLGENEVWRISSSDRWDRARVPVNTTSEFKLIFEASSSGDYWVCVDNIKYEKSRCTLTPAAALPPPVTTSSTSPSLTTPSQAGRTDPEDSSSNLGLIVGGVVAAVCLILIGLVLAILLKRKRSSEGSTCFRRQKQREEELQVRASYNAAYSLEEPAPDQFLSVDVNPKTPDSTTQQHRHGMPSPVEDDYSVITTDGATFEPPEVENDYSEVNKPEKSSLQNYPSPDENPYEIEDSSDAIPQIPTSPEDDYNKLNFHRRNHSDPHDKCTSSMDQNSDYNHLVSSEGNNLQSTDGYEDPGLFQNRDKSFNARDPQPIGVLYQNIHDMNNPDTRKPQQQSGLAHVLGQDSLQTKEGPLAEDYQLPTEATSSKPEVFPNQGEARGITLPTTSNPESGTYQVLEQQTPSTLHPKHTQPSSIDKSEDYNHLDFEIQRVVEKRGDDAPVPMYSHLNEGTEGDYDEIDREEKTEVIDGDYDHIF